MADSLQSGYIYQPIFQCSGEVLVRFYYIAGVRGGEKKIPLRVPPTKEQHIFPTLRAKMAQVHSLTYLLEMKMCGCAY